MLRHSTGMQVLASLQGPVMGVDFSTGMLAQARRAHPAPVGTGRCPGPALRRAFDLAVSFGALGHFLPAERPALFAEVYRALRPGGILAFPVGAPQPVTSSWYWALLGSTWPCGSALPCGVPSSSCTTAPARSRGPQRPGRTRIRGDDSPPDGSGPARGQRPAVRLVLARRAGDTPADAHATGRRPDSHLPGPRVCPGRSCSSVDHCRPGKRLPLDAGDRAREDASMVQGSRFARTERAAFPPLLDFASQCRDAVR